MPLCDAKYAITRYSRYSFVGPRSKGGRLFSLCFFFFQRTNVRSKARRIHATAYTRVPLPIFRRTPRQIEESAGFCALARRRDDAFVLERSSPARRSRVTVPGIPICSTGHHVACSLLAPASPRLAAPRLAMPCFNSLPISPLVGLLVDRTLARDHTRE